MKAIASLIFIFLHFFAYSQLPVMNSKPFILGETLEINSKALVEKRIINIYLPVGYNKNDTTQYPVIYLLDGAADEDFIHVVGLIQFNNFEWINRVPKSIVVGIANVDRKRDFTYPTTIKEDQKSYPTTGHSASFINFIESELQPFIEKKYKTNQSKTLIGQSLGGLFAAEVLLKRPELFSQYIIISPSIWWDNGSLLKTPLNNLKKLQNRTQVYVGVGKEGLSPGKTPRLMESDAQLLVERLKQTQNSNIQVFFDYLPQEDHATVTHQAIFNALRILYPVVK